LLGVYPHDHRGHQPYGTGHPVAVEFKGFERVVAIAVQVHALTRNHVAKGLNIEGKVGQGIHQGHVLFINGMALEQGFQMRFPAIEGVFGGGGRLGTIHQLIRTPTPDINGPDGSPFFRRHHQGAKVKRLRIFGCNLPTTLVGILHGGRRLGNWRV
jgi:hypothetical protein